jgi:hypothetical protein
MRVYKYGLLAPTVNADLVWAQLRAAHTYRNRLIEIERERRAAQRDALAGHVSTAPLEEALVRATAEVDAALAVVSRAKGSQRTRRVPDDLRVSLRAARAARGEIVRQIREARRALREDESVAARCEAIDEEANAKAKAARASCGVYWGTYLLVERAMDASREMPLYDGAEPNDPRFVCWTGEGRLGVQLQGGLALDALATDTQLQIVSAAPSPNADPHSRRSATRQRMILRMRVGSDEKKRPIWAEWPMLMHRPIPEGCVIKTAAVRVARIGPREEWTVSITVSNAPARPAPGDGTVAIDLGWRVLGDEVRACAWWDGTQGGELRIDADLLSDLAVASRIRSTRDCNFERERSSLVVARDAAGDTWPDWLRKATKFVHAWKSPGRLAQLALRWRSNRFVGDAAAYESLEAWRYHDYHLWTWESEQRQRALLRRREQYRIFAAGLARRYSRVALEAFDLRDVAQRPAPESTEGDNGQARANRHNIAPSELRGAIVDAFGGAKGGRVVFVPAEYTTMTCHVCGSIERWDQAREVSHCCSSCKTEWDQDANAARVIFASAPRSAEPPGGARNDEKTNDDAEMRGGRFARAKAKKAARLSEKEAARKVASEAAE